MKLDYAIAAGFVRLVSKGPGQRVHILQRNRRAPVCGLIVGSRLSGCTRKEFNEAACGTCAKRYAEGLSFMMVRREA